MPKAKFYPYAIGRIRVIENSLFNFNQFVQLADAKTMEDALKMLKDKGYSVANDSIVSDFEEILSSETFKVYKILHEMLNNSHFFSVFLGELDYHNLKAILKSSVSPADNAAYLVDGGSIPVAMLEKCVADKKYEAIPAHMAECIEKALEAYSQSGDGQIIDIIVDRATFAFMAKEADLDSDKSLSDYVKTLIDLTNIKNIMRIKKMKKSFSDFEAVFLADGLLKKEFFNKAWNEDSPSAAFKATPYSNICTDSLQNDLSAFEKDCDNFIMAKMKKEKNDPLSLQAVSGYLYAKKAEIKNIRIILSGKVNNIDPQIIKSRLRDAYV